MPVELRRRRGGQVLLMLTLALFAMCGVIGLVVDLGWSYYVRKSAQTAADAAALAAVKRAQDMVTGSNPVFAYQCGGSAPACADVPVDCPGVTGNLASACAYAAQHGFSSANPRQRVTVQAGNISSSATVTEACGQAGATVRRPPTAGCVDTLYWVTVRVAEQIPQLFSSIFGSDSGLVSARATAAVARVEAPGALFLIGRQNDPWEHPGTNLYLSGGPRVVVPGGIILSSNANGPAKQDPWAGYISGGGVVEAPFTRIRPTGGYYISGGGSWTATPTNSEPDGPVFEDPYAGLGQPPVTSAAVPLRPVPGGNLTAAFCGGPCPSGNYFATAQVSCGSGCTKVVATGNPISIGSNLTFSGGAFGNFHFFGGLNIGQAEVTFGPGRYVLAGVKDQSSALFDNDNKALLRSSGPNGGDAGRIFILTDSTYPGLDVHANAIRQQFETQWPGPGQNLYFGKSSIKSGNNSGSGVQLYGLNDVLIDSVAPELRPFALAPVQGRGGGIVIWQDQRNSYVKYTPDGRVDTTSCGGTLDNPCMNSYPQPPSGSPQLEIWSTPFADLQGVIYQPRGSWTLIQASGIYTGALRIVSGAMKIQGTGTLVLSGQTPPIVNYLTALVE